jgi:hypothetical protein
MERTPEERQELDYVFSATYKELRRLASTVRRGELQRHATALIWLGTH